MNDEELVEERMMEPYFVVLNDGDGRLTLLARMPGDEDFFVWGPITDEQRVALNECGVFLLGLAPFADADSGGSG